VPGQAPTIVCGGFTNIMDLEFGPDGNLYVVQRSNGPVFFASPGNVVRVGAGCSKIPVTPPLNRPGSLAFGPDGKLYVSVNSDEVGTGQVVRID
jgi:DNA-binding beta-propeller fold protein YncE